MRPRARTAASIAAFTCELLGWIWLALVLIGPLLAGAQPSAPVIPVLMSALATVPARPSTQTPELPDLAAAEALIQTEPRQAFELAGTALSRLRAQDKQRAVWYAVASEAAHALSLPDVAMRYAGDGLPYTEADSPLQQRLNIALANALTLSGRAEDAFKRLQPLSVPVDDSALNALHLEILVARALAQIKRQRYRVAVSDLLRVYKQAPEQGPRLQRAQVGFYLGAAYRVMNDEQRAEHYLNEAGAVFAQRKWALWRSRSESELAQIDLSRQQWAQAKAHLDTARDQSLLVQDEQGRAWAELGLATVARHQGQEALALRLYKSTRQLFFRTNDWSPLVSIELGLAAIARGHGQLDVALTHLQQAEKFAVTVNDASLLWPVLRERALVQSERADFAAAYADSAAAAILRDQMLEAEKDRTLAEMMVRFDSEQQEQKNTLLEQQNQLHKAQLAEQTQRNRLILVSGLALLLVLGFMAYLIVRARSIRRELQRIALTDELTGIPNRRAIMYKLGSDFERVKRYGTPLAVAMLDLDHFKQINDRFGHDAGDEVLQMFAQELKRCVRQSDDYGRFGGEEFLLLLHHAKEQDALMVAERIRVATNALQCPKLRGESRPGVSIGLALYTSADTSADALLKRADEAVYAAKHDGRNCVRLAPTPLSSLASDLA